MHTYMHTYMHTTQLVHTQLTRTYSSTHNLLHTNPSPSVFPFPMPSLPFFCCLLEESWHVGLSGPLIFCCRFGTRAGNSPSRSRRNLPLWSNWRPLVRVEGPNYLKVLDRRNFGSIDWLHTNTAHSMTPRWSTKTKWISTFVWHTWILFTCSSSGLFM